MIEIHDDDNGIGRSLIDERMIRSLSNDEILIDGDLLRTIARRRLRRWAVLGPVLFAGLAGVQLLIMPQRYDVTTSVAVQQGPNLSSPLAAFTSANTNTKYIGLLQSRRLAEIVENRYHLQRLYHMRTRAKTLEMLIDSVRPEDNATNGLLQVHVSLPGAPRFGPDPDRLRRQLPGLVADVANAYVDALRNYFATSDNDRASVLLAAADEELHNAREEYDRKTRVLRAYMQDIAHFGSQGGPISANESGLTTSGSTGLAALYEKQIDTQAEIAQIEATKQAEDAGTQRLVNNVAEIPSDDPFLRSAREHVSAERRAYLHLVDGLQLAPENPQVVTAQTQLSQAETELDRQKQAARRNLTTMQVDVDMKLQGLQARLATIRANINAAERKLPGRRARTLDLDLMQKEMEFAAARLKEGEVKGVELRLTEVSGKSRLSVVDRAIPPDTSQPGPLRAALISLLFTVLPLGVSIVWTYMRQVRQRAVIALRIESGSSLPLREVKASVPSVATNGTDPTQPHQEEVQPV